ncbi:unnamed protein product [Symbiodinium microadriaticum]|nr:unnamed protein product [Symbiodinium sp. KB8]CAE7889534.1 unnamed protein product [Symbiodinium microadriaticum]
MNLASFQLHSAFVASGCKGRRTAHVPSRRTETSKSGGCKCLKRVQPAGARWTGHDGLTPLWTHAESLIGESRNPEPPGRVSSPRQGCGLSIPLPDHLGDRAADIKCTSLLPTFSLE